MLESLKDSLRPYLAVAAALAAYELAPRKYKATAAVVVGIAAYASRIGASAGEPTWPWDAGSGGKAAPGSGDAEKPQRRTEVDVTGPRVVTPEEYADQYKGE